MKLRSGLPSLRHKPLARLVFASFAAAKARFGARLVHFSVQSNHLHLIVEVDDRRALSRAAQGLATRLALRLNARLGRRGKAFADRYHARSLRTPLEVRRALVYVLHNHRHHHSGSGRPSRFDPFSSAAYFYGFTVAVSSWPTESFAPPSEPPVVRATTWLLRKGWQLHGPISPNDAPASHVKRLSTDESSLRSRCSPIVPAMSLGGQARTRSHAMSRPRLANVRTLSPKKRGKPCRLE
jgi:REP element-mobilizing transposase RayT